VKAYRLARRHALWLPIVALHAAMLLLAPRERQPERRPTVVIAVRSILPPPTRNEPSRPPMAALPFAPVVREALRREIALPVQPTTLISSATVPTEPAVDEAPALPELAPVPLLHSDATRRAIREAARQPLLSERAASASQDPGRENAQSRLGREIQQAGTTDCLKGDFLGGGGGLMSLPLWVVAEARGKCKR
jgi:hypothetical protein